MAGPRYLGYKRPKHIGRTLCRLLRYLGGYKWVLLLVTLLVCVSTGANLAGTYLLKPVINGFILPGDRVGLKQALTGMGVMYACGAAATYGYGQLMVHTAQRVIGEIRADLFAHVQTLPL